MRIFLYVFSYPIEGSLHFALHSYCVLALLDQSQLLCWIVAAVDRPPYP